MYIFIDQLNKFYLKLKTPISFTGASNIDIIQKGYPNDYNYIGNDGFFFTFFVFN